MITKGIIEQVLDKYTVRVRLPIYDKSKYDNTGTPTNSLGIAHFCSLPHTLSNAQVGDIVYVGFEDNDYGKPIILGYLSMSGEHNTYAHTQLDSLETITSTKLCYDTTIGNVTAQEITYLQGLTGSIQGQLDVIGGKLNQFESGAIQIDSITINCGDSNF